MSNAAEKAGLHGLTLHGLRHTAASLLRGSGAHDELIRAAFGWSNVSTQEGYTHRQLYDQGEARAVESFLKKFRASH